MEKHSSLLQREGDSRTAGEMKNRRGLGKTKAGRKGWSVSVSLGIGSLTPYLRIVCVSV